MRPSVLVTLAALAVAVAVLVGCGWNVDGGGRPVDVAGGDARRGPDAIVAHGCGSCHTIPGVRAATAGVGPPLYFWSERVYIAGAIENTPDNLIRWIRDPQAVEPGTAMPDMGVPEQDARDIAAYLFTLRR